VSLVSLGKILKIPINQKRLLTVVLLNKNAKGEAEVGVIIEKILGNKSKSDLPSDLFQLKEYQNMQLFETSILDDKIWQPQRFAQLYI
jgi:hypothetical protein